MERIGRFAVVRPLGQGGMGSVFLARDVDLQRDIAIKLLHRSGAGRTAARARFREEGRALAQINHPGIVTIYEIGEHDGQQFIAMEYLRGRSLRELLQATPPPPRDRLLAICTDVCRAVAAAHARGILHRDLKPENIVAGDDGTKVVDFGLARRIGTVSLPAAVSRTDLASAQFDQTIKMFAAAEAETAATLATLAPAGPQATMPGTLYGTPAYMAPEVLEGAPASAASDIYSLGVTLYECLGGRRPFDAPSLVELISTIVDPAGTPAPIADPLWPLIERMLARDPDARPALAVVADTLSPPAAAAPPRPPSRAPWIAGVLVLAVVGGGLVWWRTHAAAPATGALPPIAVDAIDAKLADWGDGRPQPVALGDLLGKLIESTGVRVIAPRDLSSESQVIPQWDTAAKELGARRMVHCKLAQQGAIVTASVELIDLDTGVATPFTVTGKPDAIPVLLLDIADQVVGRLQPGLAIDRTPDRARARRLLDDGREAMARFAWAHARPYLEQAAQTDPSFAEAWGEVAAIRGWTIAPQAQTLAAIERAIETESDPVRREVWQGARLFHQNQLAAAIARLTPLVDRTDLPRPLRDTLLFYLGDAHWHDGSPTTGVAFFHQLLERDEPFAPARIHAREYALANRKYADLPRFDRFEHARVMTAFARGDYDSVIASGQRPDTLYAQILTDRIPPPSELDAHARGLIELGRATTPAERDRAFDAAWGELAGRPPNTIAINLGVLAELVLALDYERGIRELAAWIEQHGPRPISNDRMVAILGAPSVPGSPRTFSRDGLSSRQRKVADAIEAELAGDRDKAIAILDALIRDPMSNWDYPERAALARNLIATRRSRELAALCADTRTPAVFRFAWFGIDRRCRASAPAKRR